MFRVRSQVVDLTIQWAPDRSVPGRMCFPPQRRLPSMLLAHGAGGGRDSPFVDRMGRALAAVGAPVLTFDYPYVAEARRAPDRVPTLLSCHGAALARLRAEVPGDPVLAGRSMGGRMASLLAARGEPCRALVLFAYPLHPAGRPERLRTAHLPDLAAREVPVLFLTGTRDRLARMDLLEPAVAAIPTASLEVVEGADHSFRVPKADGRSWEEIMDGLVATTVRWLEEVSPLRGAGSSRDDGGDAPRR